MGKGTERRGSTGFTDPRSQQKETTFQPGGELEQNSTQFTGNTGRRSRNKIKLGQQKNFSKKNSDCRASSAFHLRTQQGSIIQLLSWRCWWKYRAACLRVSAPDSKTSLSFPFWRPAQYEIKELAKQMTSVGDLINFPSKEKLFLVSQIAQQIAERQTMWNFFPSFRTTHIQIQNCSKEVVGRHLAPRTWATML